MIPAPFPLWGARSLDDDPIIRGHAAWALGRIATPEARELLSARMAAEADAEVRDEIREALGAVL